MTVNKIQMQICTKPKPPQNVGERHIANEEKKKKETKAKKRQRKILIPIIFIILHFVHGKMAGQIEHNAVCFSRQWHRI